MKGCTFKCVYKPGQ